MQKITLLLLLTLACFILDLQLEAQNPDTHDESGTQVVGFVTKGVAIIAVDSRISIVSNKGGATKRLLDETRKNLEVGNTSACVINGWLGTEKTPSDVRAVLGRWAAEHPSVEATEAIPELQKQIAQAWELDHDPRYFQKAHPPGSPLTALTCATFASGKPQLLVAKTYVGQDYPYPVISMSVEQRTSALSGILIDEILPIWHISKQRVQQEEPNAVRIVEKIEFDPQTTEAQRVWIQQISHQENGPALTDKQAALLMEKIFSAVELYDLDDVAPPNIAYYVGVCGRKRLTVEEIAGFRCPKPANQDTRRPSTDHN